MNNQKITIGHIGWSPDYKSTPDPKLLKGMQGPELGLVEESRSARQQGSAEEVKPGERGVGEIVGAVELRSNVERWEAEARRHWSDAHSVGCNNTKSFFAGQIAVLEKLKGWLSDTAEKRSDLSNA